MQGIKTKIDPKKLTKHEKGQLIESAKKRDRQRAEARKDAGARRREKAVVNEYLKKGQEYKAEKEKEKNADAQAYAWEAASYVQNRLRGAISIVPSLSEKFCENYDRIDWGKKGD